MCKATWDVVDVQQNLSLSRRTEIDSPRAGVLWDVGFGILNDVLEEFDDME